MKSVFLPGTALILLLAALPAAAQFRLPRIPGLSKAGDAADAIGGVVITDKEEAEIGAQISAGLRRQYGVVQNKAVHRYVALVGSLLAAESTRPNLPWTFIVLDTPGVNAFAAPGGYVHITRGALALMHSESELAGVLAHEITHVTNKHALGEIRKAQGTKIAAAQTHNEKISMIADAGFAVVKGNLWGKPQEMESDSIGVALASKVGYAPTGLGTFLTALMERNKAIADLKEKDRAKVKNGLFSTHPEMQDRVSKINKLISEQKLTAGAIVAPRYTRNVAYKVVPVAQLAAQMKANEKKPAANEKKPGAPAASEPEQSSILHRGLGVISTPFTALSNRQDAGVAYARNVDVEQFAPGGPNPNPVSVALTPRDIADFKRGVQG